MGSRPSRQYKQVQLHSSLTLTECWNNLSHQYTSAAFKCATKDRDPTLFFNKFKQVNCTEASRSKQYHLLVRQNV